MENINMETKNDHIISRIFYTDLTAMCLIDIKEWKITEANNRFYEILNAGKDSSRSNKKEYGCLYKSFIKNIKEKFKEAETNKEVEFTLKGENNKIDILCSYVKINNGEREYLLSTLSDITEKNNVINSLKESEEKFRMISAAVPTAIFMYRNEELIYVNEMASKISGYSTEELLNMKFWEIVHPDYRKQVRQLSANRLTGGNGPAFYNLKTVAKDGSVKWLAIYAGILNIDGKKNILGSAIDITERKENEETFATLVHTIKSISEAVTITDIENNILFINDAFTKMFGYTADEAIGKNIGFINPEPDTVASVLKKTKLGGWEGELINVKKDGSKLPIFLSTSVVCDDMGNIIGLVGISKDITERKKAEHALLESEQKYKELFDNSPIGIYRTTPDGEIIMANPAIVNMLGFSDFEELAQKNIEEKASPEILKARETFKKLLEKNNKIKDFENIWAKKNGEYIYVRENARTVKNENGKIIFYDGTVEDITARKKAEKELSKYQKNLENLIEERTKKLSESGEMFRALAENIDDTVVRFDREMKILYANPAVEKLTGVNSVELVGFTFEEIGFTENVVAVLKKALKYVFKHKEKKRVEFNLPNGNWVDWMFLPEFDENGAVNTILSSARDITERKLSEEELIRKDKILNGVAQGISKLLLNIDFEKAIMEMLKIVGTSAEVDSISVYENSLDAETGSLIMNEKFRWVKTSRMKDKYSPITKAEYEPDFARWLKNLPNGKTINGLVEDFPFGEQMALRKTKIVSLVAVPIIIQDNFWGFIRLDDCKKEREWSSSELTVLNTLAADLGGAISRREIEERLRKSEERWRTLFEFSPEAYFLIDKTAAIIDVNHQAQNLLGYSIRDVYKKSIFDLNLINENHRLRLAELIDNGIKNKPGGPAEIIFMTKKDRAIIVEVRLYPVTINDQKLMLFSAQDIRIRKQAEADIIKALEKAQELNQIKSRFVSMVSHEFRTPLSTILTSVEIIDMFEDKLTRDERDAHLKKIVKSIDYLTAILNDVITINRVDSGKLEVKYEEVEIINFITNLIEDIKASYQETPVIQFRTNKKTAKVKTDTKLITQIFSNLLGNAIKYTPVEKNIYVDFEITNYKIKLVIEDEGVGIPADDQKNLFIPFFRADNIGKTPGSGLGLSITKTCVDMLNGDINFKSLVGRGSTFTVNIPA